MPVLEVGTVTAHEFTVASGLYLALTFWLVISTNVYMRRLAGKVTMMPRAPTSCRRCPSLVDLGRNHRDSRGVPPSLAYGGGEGSSISGFGYGEVTACVDSGHGGDLADADVMIRNAPDDGQSAKARRPCPGNGQRTWVLLVNGMIQTASGTMKRSTHQTRAAMPRCTGDDQRRFKNKEYVGLTALIGHARRCVCGKFDRTVDGWSRPGYLCSTR